VQLHQVVTLGGATPGHDRVGAEAKQVAVDPLQDVGAALAGMRRGAFIVNLAGDVEGVETTVKATSPLLRERCKK